MFESVKLTVVGDVMLDEYHCGMQSISGHGEEVFREYGSWFALLGGAAAAAGMAAALDAQVQLVGVIGVGDDADRLSYLAEGSDIHLSAVRSKQRLTTVKRRFMSSPWNQEFRSDRETLSPVDDLEQHELCERIHAAIENADVVLVSDYRKGCVTRATFRAVVEAALVKRVPVIVDAARGEPWSKYRGAECIKGSQGSPTDGELSIADLSSAPTIVLTYAERGLSLRHAGAYKSRHFTCRNQPKFAVDSTGCGDMVSTLLALCRGARIDYESTCKIAVEFAAAESQVTGARPLEWRHVGDELVRKALGGEPALVILASAEHDDVAPGRV